MDQFGFLPPTQGISTPPVRKQLSDKADWCGDQTGGHHTNEELKVKAELIFPKTCNRKQNT